MKEILERYGYTCPKICQDRYPIEKMLDLSRSDEREKAGEAYTKGYIAGIEGSEVWNNQKNPYSNSSGVELPKSGMTEAEFQKANAGAEIVTPEGRIGLIIAIFATNDGNRVVYWSEEQKIAVTVPKSSFMQSFRLRSTKQEGWKIIWDNQGYTDIYASLEAAEMALKKCGGGIVAHVTWEELK